MKTKLILVAVAMAVLMTVAIYTFHKVSIRNMHETHVVQLVVQAGFSDVFITDSQTCTVTSKMARSEGVMYTVLARDSQGEQKVLNVFRRSLTGDTRIM